MKRRSWFRVHSWLGVMAGLLLFIICWSGSFAVVGHELDWLLDARMRVQPRTETASWGQLHAAVLSAYPQAQNVSIEAPLYRNFAAVAALDLPEQEYVRLYLDPYTAQVLGRGSFFGVQRFFRSFHMSLFNLGLGYPAGYFVVTAFSLTLLASLASSLLFYRRWWRAF
jgi:uncharacterized iron-regulated membrane protein